MKFGVVVFPGSDSEEFIDVFNNILNQDIVELWHKDTDLQGVDFVIIPGGFSFGDYLRPGALAKFSPIMEAVANHCKNGGYALGIGNGFQVLCEAGLLPGTLLENDKGKYVCDHIFIKAATSSVMLTAGLEPERVLRIPIGHGAGRYFAPSKDLKTLNENQQVVFRYCDKDGIFNADSNPNGSAENIAGICNETKNVFGMMPHPQRAVKEILGNTDGRLILESIISSLQPA